ncbi:hypothetical protein ACOSQ3_014250 [Xanthoceras sorbifolium]
MVEAVVFSNDKLKSKGIVLTTNVKSVSKSLNLLENESAGVDATFVHETVACSPSLNTDQIKALEKNNDILYFTGLTERSTPDEGLPMHDVTGGKEN